MALSHSYNTIVGCKNTASTGGVGGNEYPTSGEDINDKESPNDTVEINMFALGTDGDAASADCDCFFDFYYDTIFGGLVAMTTDNASGASGTSSFTEDENVLYYPISGTGVDFAGSSRIHYSNDSAVAGQTYPGPVDSIKLVHSKTTVQDLNTTTETFSMSRFHFQGTGAPSTIGTYTNDTWFSVHNVGGQSGLDVPTDGIGIRVRARNETSTSGNQSSRLQTDHVIECWVKLSGQDDTKVFEYKLALVSRSDSTF
jgi:hypothetical protein